MLFPSLYQIHTITKTENHDFEAVIELNPTHNIFKGHFPDQPVLPGVCMMQIIKEVTEQVLNVKLQLVESNNIKFMALINPMQNPTLRLVLQITNAEPQIKVKNTTYFNEVTALKFSGTYKKIAP